MTPTRQETNNVIPAKAGIQWRESESRWIAAFAGVTPKEDNVLWDFFEP